MIREVKIHPEAIAIQLRRPVQVGDLDHDRHEPVPPFHVRHDALRAPRPLGAVRTNVGQGEQPWSVLADPEGNEFCVLSSRRPTR
ncbi:MAG TPA: VOC family protein [Acidimicrobiia bacterium]|nr:VOC family protein [Acidimicrobiia bacterium]